MSLTHDSIVRRFIKSGRRGGLVSDPRRQALFSKPARTMLFVILFAALPFAFPQIQQHFALNGQSFKEMLPKVSELIAFRHNSSRSFSSSANEAPAGMVNQPTKEHANECVAGTIEDPNHQLDSFNAALLRTEQKSPGAITRITHYGDSPITNDGITATVRLLLQKQFGDAGHGFILIDRPWAWYGHQAITFTSGGGWNSDSLMNPQVRDGQFGLGGVAFHAGGPGKYARYATADSGDNGRNFSLVDVYYLAQPHGGQFSVGINDTVSETVSTASDSAHSGFYAAKAPQSGENSFTVKTSGGNVRLFGAVLENDGPGVVYDSLGVNGAFAGLLATVMNEQHWAEQLQHRKPNLVILNYGANESQFASDDQMARYDKELRAVVQRVKTALPQASVLIVSPMDRGKRVPGGRIITLPSIPKIVEMQRRVALETDCAFLDLFAAMGGDSTMARWHQGKKHLVGGDLTHPTAEGAQTVGTMIYMALLQRYVEYKTREAYR